MKNRMKMIQLSMEIIKTGLEMSNDEVKDITRNIPEKIIRDRLKKNNENLTELIEAFEVLIEAMGGGDDNE